MRNKIHLMIGVLALFLSCCELAFAVEYTENVTAQSETPSVAKDVSINAMQSAAAIPQPVSQPSMDIDEMTDNFLKKANYHRGWNPNKETFIAVGTSVVDCEDPSYDDSFITKRSLKSMEAILDAKSQIIEFVRVEMSAFDQASTPGTDLSTQFKEKITKLQKKIDSQRKKLVKMLKEVDAAEAASLEGATFGDRLNKLMDAAIKKLDAEYSSKKIEEEKMARYQKIKKRYEDASVECDKLSEELKLLKGSKKETLHSKVETLASMPLMGALVLAQFEQWDETEEKFRTAVIVIWSKKMEALVRAFISGKPMIVPPGKMSLANYIAQNDWSSSTGGRRFRDNNGNVYFIGIGSAAAGSSASSEKRARGIATMIAKKEVATAVFADVASHKIAEQMMESYNGGSGKDTSVAVENYASELKQSIKKRTISGMQSQFLRILKHPISDQRIFVSIYAVSGDSARQALLMEEGNYLSRAMDIKSQQYQKGVKAGHEESLQRAHNDTSAYQQGKTHSNSSPSRTPASSSGNGATGGAYEGAGSDDASW